MSTNKISAVLSDEAKASALAGISQTKNALPFLISLSTENRKKSRVMGPKSIEYVNLNLLGSKSFGEVLPSTIDVAEFERDVAAVNNMLAVRIEMASLLEKVDDTILAAGSDAMTTADTVYAYLKTAAKNNGAVKDLIAEISKRFKGQGSKKA